MGTPSSRESATAPLVWSWCSCVSTTPAIRSGANQAASRLAISRRAESPASSSRLTRSVPTANAFPELPLAIARTVSIASPGASPRRLDVLGPHVLRRAAGGQEATVGRAQLGPGEQLGSAPQRPQQRLLAPPARDRGVV